jgi:hypothetical protein
MKKARKSIDRAAPKISSVPNWFTKAGYCWIQNIIITDKKRHNNYLRERGRRGDKMERRSIKEASRKSQSSAR